MLTIKTVVYKKMMLTIETVAYKMFYMLKKSHTF